MPSAETNLASRSGNLVETHKSYQPRVIFFYFVFAFFLIVLVTGLAYQQLFQSQAHRDVERVQNQRRIVVPGPRGNIYDRNGKLLVGNRPRLAVVVYLDELRAEINQQYRLTRIAYRKTGDKDLPTADQMIRISRVAVVQGYLDQVNAILGRQEKVDGEDLDKHFLIQRLLPYVLIEDLEPEEYARLLERIPVKSPLQVYTSSTRFYPFGSAAAHTLGYVGVSDEKKDNDAQDEDAESEDKLVKDIRTFKMRGTIGRDGLEQRFDSLLQGEAGATLFRVDPAGYKINAPLAKRLPVQGKNLTTSIDIDLQLAAEEALGERRGSAVALDVRTGEVLVLANKPDYNLNAFSPRLTHAAVADIEARQAWTNLAIAGAYPPGSTFKILTSIAALRAGVLTPDQPIIDCEGVIRVAGHDFVCDNRHGMHGEALLRQALAVSCDIYYYEAGRRLGVDGMAAEGRRFHFGERTGIELPNETGRMVLPDPEWKRRTRNEPWVIGDSLHMAIGQGDVLVTSMEMACFAASVARNEVFTQPTLVHRADAPTQKSQPIGLTPEQRTALLEGMEAVTKPGGTASILSLAAVKIPGIRIAGKTGTAQIPGNKNEAWFICFAPLEKPEIAIAVAIEGDTAGESYGGGANASPVANEILRKYFAKKGAAASAGPGVE